MTINPLQTMIQNIENEIDSKKKDFDIIKKIKSLIWKLKLKGVFYKEDENIKEKIINLKQRIAAHFKSQEGMLLADRVGEFVKDLMPSDPSSRLKWLIQRVQRGEITALTLVRNLENLELKVDPRELIELYKLIASRRVFLEGGQLLYQFDKLGLENANPKDIVDLCKYIISTSVSGNDGGHVAVGSIDKLGLEKANLQDRLDLYKHIVLHGGGYGLAEIFDKLGLERANLQDRLDLCKLIASQGEWTAGVLAENWNKLGLEKANLQDRLELIKLIASQGWPAQKALAEKFCSLGLEKASLQVLLDLCNLITIDEQTSKALAENFRWPGVDKPSLQNQLALCKYIASQGGPAAKALAKNFRSLGLEKATAQERVDLCKHIASQGGPAARALIKNFRSLGLENTPQKSLDLCKFFASQDGWTAKVLAENFPSLGLEKASSQELVDLCKHIASQGDRAAEDVTKNLRHLGLEKASLTDLLNLCNIASQGISTAWDLACQFFKLGLNPEIYRQLLLELLMYPSFPHWFELPDPLPSFLSLFEDKDAPIDAKGLKKFLDENRERIPLHKLFENVDKTKIEIVKLQLMQWLAYTAGVLHDVNDKKVAEIDKSKIIEDIMFYHNPSHRVALVRQLSLMDLTNLKELPSVPK